MPASLQKFFAFSNGATERMSYAIEGATGTTANQFNYGDPLKASATDNLICYLDKSSSGTQNANSPATMVGFALRNHKGATGSDYDLPFVRAEEGVMIQLPVYSATAANAVYSNVHVGDKLGVIVVNGIIAADIDNAAHPVFIVVDKLPGYAATEKYAPVWLKVISTVRAF